MKGFENVAVGKSAVPALIVTMILLVAITALFFIYWKKKHKLQTNILYLIAGAVGFFVTARVLEVVVHYFCIIADNPVSRFINGNTAVYVLYGALMAGVFEECGRHIILKYIMKKNRTSENAVLYGIGHGGIEVLTVVLPLMITYLAIAIVPSGNTEKALGVLKITEENAAASLPVVQAAVSFDFVTAALNVLERLYAMFLHIGLTVLVYYGVVNEKKLCLPAAIVLHMIADAFAALYQKGAMPLWAVEVWGVFWAAVITWIAVKLYKKMKAAASAATDREEKASFTEKRT